MTFCYCQDREVDFDFCLCPSGSVQSEHNQKPMKTCERIAQENHSSASSVRRAEYYAPGVDVADELSPGFRNRFFREELHIPRNSLISRNKTTFFHVNIIDPAKSSVKMI